MFCVKLGGFRGVMCGVKMMGIGNMRVMSGRVMIAGFVVPRGFAMMTGGVIVMFRCFVMMLCCLLGHLILLAV
jgi:hypothetical protein